MKYEEAERILRKNLDPLPRSWSEARRDADYATGLWRCETEWDRTKRYLIPTLLLTIIISSSVFVFYPAFQYLIEVAR